MDLMGLLRSITQTLLDPYHGQPTLVKPRAGSMLTIVSQFRLLMLQLSLSQQPSSLSCHLLEATSLSAALEMRAMGYG